MPSSRKTPVTHLDPHAPCVFNTRALTRSPGSSRQQTLTVPAPPGLGAGMARIPAGADVALEVLLESVTEGVLVTLRAHAPVVAECARCLEHFTASMDVDSQELFSYSQDAGEGREGGYSLDGDLLDVAPVLRDALVLALPLAPRCSDDCPGLCAECGVRLAQAGPGHRHDDMTDPRWDELRRWQAHAGTDGAPVPDRDEENRRGRP